MTQVEETLGRCPVRVGAKLRGRYEVLQAVTRGTRGIIFLAQRCTVQRRLESPVADIIKGRNPKESNAVELSGEQFVLKVSDGEAEFRNEIWITSNQLQKSIGSPEVIEVFPLVRQPWTVCVMECLGPDLRKVRDKYVFDEALCRSGLESLLRGLEVAHRLNIAHCDVQPSNICEALHGHGWRLLDWGDAEHMEERLLQGVWGSGQRGSCYYQAPEMLSDRGWGLGCDIWSLGVVLVEIFLGHVDDDQQQLFDLPAVCGGRSVLEQMERMFGRLPDWLRGERPELNKYGDASDLFKRFPPVLADLLKRFLIYEPSERISASEALLHPWFMAIDPVEWVELKLKEAKAHKKISAVEQTCIDAAIQQILNEHDFRNADRLLHHSVEFRFHLRGDTIGTNLLGCFEYSKYKNIDYWLGVLRTGGLSLSEPIAFDVVTACARFRPRDAAAFMYALEDLGTVLSSRMFTELIASSSGPEKIMQMERHLDALLKRGLQPESRGIVILFEAYSVSYPLAQSNRRAPRYTIRSITPPPLSTQSPSQSRSLSPRSFGKNLSGSSTSSPRSSDNAKSRASAIQVRQAENTLQNLLLAEPPILLEPSALEAIYASMGEQRLQVFKKDSNFGRRLHDAELRGAREVQRQKEEATKLEEERMHKKNARAEWQGANESKPSADTFSDGGDDDAGDLEPMICNPKKLNSSRKLYLRPAGRKPWITKPPKVSGWR